MTLGVALVGTLAVGAVAGALLSEGGAALGASKKCTNASLNGAYGIRFEGNSKALGQFASVSLWTFDGKGKLAASEDYNSEKTGPQTRKISGGYAVKSDCTFELLFPSELAKQHEATGSCVLVDNRREFHCLDVEEGWITLGSGQKI